MNWSMKVCRLAGIRVYVHWTFVILIAWVVAARLFAGESLAAAFGDVLFVLSVFGCVVLHELGHALAARRYGVGTRDIVLLPIGGVARLERIPENPTQELVIAVAGPAVNVVIVVALLAGLMVSEGLPRLPSTEAEAGEAVRTSGYLVRLMAVNVFLVVFNALPAFPMDGGRVLRALLAYTMEYERATYIAARVGQAIAIVLALLGLFTNPFLVLIAVFVFLGAEAESQGVQMRSGLAGLRVADGMMTRFRVLSVEDRLSDAAGALLAGSQQDFPVIEGRESGPPYSSRVVGMLGRSELLRALAQGGMGVEVGSAMRGECPVVEPGMALQRAVERMRESMCSAVAVVEGGRLVGLVSSENVAELMQIRAAVGKGWGRRG